MRIVSFTEARNELKDSLDQLINDADSLTDPFYPKIARAPGQSDAKLYQSRIAGNLALASYAARVLLWPVVVSFC